MTDETVRYGAITRAVYERDLLLWGESLTVVERYSTAYTYMPTYLYS